MHTRSGKVRLAVGVAGVALLLWGCGSSGDHSVGAAASVPSPTTAAATPRIARWLVGEWSAHTLGLTVDSRGTGRMSWRTYRTCGEDPPPCDTFEGNTIRVGGQATIRLTTTGPTTASGRVVTSSDPADLPLGPVRLRFDPNGDVIHSRLSLGRPVLCGPHAAVTRCG